MYRGAARALRALRCIRASRRIIYLLFLYKGREERVPAARLARDGWPAQGYGSVSFRCWKCALRFLDGIG